MQQEKVPTARRPRRVVIVGAGIGGLAAGAILRRDGHEVTVLERAERFEPLGAGLALWPNGARALREIGVGATADAAEVPRGDGGIRRARDGKLITAISPEVLERRYGAPLALVHRAELQGALLAAAGDGVVRFGAEAREVGADGAVGLATGERLETEVIVGADGINSATRAALLGDGPPRASGVVAYRAVVDDWGGELAAGEYWGRGEVFGVAPLSRRRVYWYAAHRAELAGDAGEDRLAGLLARHGSWAEPIPRLLAATRPQALLRHELFDRTPIDAWGRDAVTLLGDAGPSDAPLPRPGCLLRARGRGRARRRPARQRGSARGAPRLRAGSRSAGASPRGRLARRRTHRPRLLAGAHEDSRRGDGARPSGSPAATARPGHRPVAADQPALTAVPRVFDRTSRINRPGWANASAASRKNCPNKWKASAPIARTALHDLRSWLALCIASRVLCRHGHSEIP